MNTSFSELCLSAPITNALGKKGYNAPTPIQREAIPKILSGSDLLATAQTGTGKTAAFSLPLLELLQSKKQKAQGIRALILAPTRELALQIADNIRHYSSGLPLKTAVVIGGVPIERQIRTLRGPVDILIATPGRLLDLMNQIKLSLSGVEMLVLDEADRMLDMGFIHDLRRILAKLPEQRQTLLFSATMSKEIAELSRSFLRNPERLEIAPPATVSSDIEQSVLFVDVGDKAALLHELIRDERSRRILVFTRTKHRANRVAQQLSRQGISSEAIHSNKSQGQRQRALSAFHSGRVKVLVATDIVARGIDVDNISRVINFELPDDSESYVHRIGRTARAGAKGQAISFCSADELPTLRQIERLLKGRITVDESHSYHSKLVADLSSRRSGEVSSFSRRPARGSARPASGVRRYRGNGRQRSGGGGSYQQQRA